MPLDPHTERHFGEWYRSLASNIYAFCNAVGHRPTKMQMGMLDAAQRGDRRVACRSGQGTGKTRTMAIVMLWFLFSRTFARGVITAPSMRQAQNVALNECKQVVDASPDERLKAVFSFLKGSMGLFGHDAETWGCRCVTASSPESLQGLHAEHLFIWAEEASGIPKTLMEALYGTCSGPSNRLYAIGNPNTRTSAFFDMFHSDRHLWRCLHWNSEHVPNSKWFSQERNDFVAEKYGKDSDVYRVRCLGEFPRMDASNIIDPQYLEACMEEKIRGKAYANMLEGKTIRQFGMDFARFGNDESTIFRRSGNAVLETQFFSHTDPSEVVDIAFRMQAEACWKDEDCLYVPDAGGMGQGIMHKFHQAGKRTHEFHTQARPRQTEIFANAASEAWFDLAVKVKGLNAYFPKDSRLFEQLTNRRYYTTKTGLLIVESKDDYKRRGFDSPDRADGAIMCQYDKVTVRAQHASAGGAPTTPRNPAVQDWNRLTGRSAERSAGQSSPLGSGIGLRRG